MPQSDLDLLDALMKEYLRRDHTRDSPEYTAARLDEIRVVTQRLLDRLRPPSSELPDSVVAQIPIYLPRHDPDRNIQILLTALDFYSISSASDALDHHRRTIRGIAEWTYTSLEREGKRLLGPQFHPPPRNPRRREMEK